MYDEKTKGLPTTDVAKILQVHRNVVEVLKRRRVLNPLKYKGRYYYDEQEVLSYKKRRDERKEKLKLTGKENLILVNSRGVSVPLDKMSLDDMLLCERLIRKKRMEVK